jgi:hypothetical protein
MIATTAISVEHFKFLPIFFVISITFFLGVGWLLGRFRPKKFGASGQTIDEVLVTAIFGLTALVLGLTFSNA